MVGGGAINDGSGEAGEGYSPAKGKDGMLTQWRLGEQPRTALELRAKYRHLIWSNPEGALDKAYACAAPGVSIEDRLPPAIRRGLQRLLVPVAKPDCPYCRLHLLTNQLFDTRQGPSSGWLPASHLTF